MGGVVQKQAGHDPPERKLQLVFAKVPDNSRFHSGFLQEKIPNVKPVKQVGTVLALLAKLCTGRERGGWGSGQSMAAFQTPSPEEIALCTFSSQTRMGTTSGWRAENG